MSQTESFAFNGLMKTHVILSENVKSLTEIVKTKLNLPKKNDNDVGDKRKMDNIIERKASDVRRASLKLNENTTVKC